MKIIKSIINSLRISTSGKKVDFMIAGVQKAGTSALDAYLRGHPEICMADVKEVHFFDRDKYFLGGPSYLAYHSHFSPSGANKLLGEATPIYAYWDSCIQQIWKYNPKIKIIVVLRNPIERAYSHWNMERQRGLEELPFLEAVKNESNRCKKDLPKQSRVFSYVDRGWYSEQIRRIWRFFPKEQTLFIKHEKMLSSPNEALEELWGFLEVPPISVTKKMVHSRSYESKMTPEEYDMLKKLYSHEIKQVESMLGWDCSDWLSGGL